MKHPRHLFHTLSRFYGINSRLIKEATDEQYRLRNKRLNKASKILFIILLLAPINALASTCFTVSGAGSSAVNGTYSPIGNSSIYNGGTVGQEAYGINGLTNSYLLSTPAGGYATLKEVTGYSVSGYYYSSIPTGDYGLINTLDGLGTNPVPTIASTTCAVAPTTPDFSYSTTTQVIDNPTQDIFMLWIVFALTSWGMVTLFKRK